MSSRGCSKNVPLLCAKGWLQASRQDENVVELVRHEDVVVIGNQCWRGSNCARIQRLDSLLVCSNMFGIEAELGETLQKQK